MTNTQRPFEDIKNEVVELITKYLNDENNKKQTELCNAILHACVEMAGSMIFNCVATSKTKENIAIQASNFLMRSAKEADNKTDDVQH